MPCLFIYSLKKILYRGNISRRLSQSELFERREFLLLGERERRERRNGDRLPNLCETFHPRRAGDKRRGGINLGRAANIGATVTS